MKLRKALGLIMALAVAATMTVAVGAFDGIFDFDSNAPSYEYGAGAPTWETNTEPHRPGDSNFDWSCGNKSCNVKMSGIKPPACIRCNDTEISRTSGKFMRDFLSGNIRPAPDAFGRPTDTPVTFVMLMLSALVLGLVMSALYKGVTRKGQPSSANFAITLVILPMVIATVVFVIGQNIAAAFGLAGVFSMTRFRSNASNSKDIAFVFVSVALGLSCGMGFVFYALIVAVVLCALLLVLNAIGYGELKAEPKLLRINVPESISYGEIFDSVLEKYAYTWDVARVKTLDLGATFEITYSLMLKQGVNEKEFIDELRTRNGNLSIILRLDNRREGRGM